MATLDATSLSSDERALLQRFADCRRKDLVRGDLYSAANELDLEDVAIDFAVHVETPEWLAGRREIKSFFIAEVDRDLYAKTHSGTARFIAVVEAMFA